MIITYIQERLRVHQNAAYRKIFIAVYNPGLVVGKRCLQDVLNAYKCVLQDNHHRQKSRQRCVAFHSTYQLYLQHVGDRHRERHETGTVSGECARRSAPTWLLMK